MEFTDAIKAGFQKYFDFRSRSCRSEYWFWLLFICIGSIVFSIMDLGTAGVDASGFGPFSLLFELGILIPWLAVSIRRLHDIGQSGWWILLSVIPFVGWIILIVWAATKGTEGANQFGEDPLEVNDPA